MAPSASPEDPYTRVVFALDDGRELRFADVRTFGTLHFLGDDQDGGPRGLAELGPEPLTMRLRPTVLAAALAGRRAPVKSVLLDQRRVAGLGNIYADEALHEAGIHPQRPAGQLGADEVQRLHRAIRSVLRAAVSHGGTTIRDYVDGRGVPARVSALFAACTDGRESRARGAVRISSASAWRGGGLTCAPSVRRDGAVAAARHRGGIDRRHRQRQIHRGAHVRRAGRRR